MTELVLHGFDVGGRHRLAPAAHEVAGPAHDGQEPVPVLLGQIPGAVPTVDQAGRGGPGVVEVAVEEQRAPHPQLAVHVPSDPDAGRRWTAAARMVGEVGLVEARHAARLGGAVEDPEVDVGQQSGDGVEELGRGGRRAGVGHPQGRQRARSRRADQVDQALPHGGNAVEAGGPVAGHGLADLVGCSRSDQHHRVAGLPLLEGDGPCPHVEQRVGTDHGAPGLQQCARVGAQMVGPVRQDRPFRPPGAAAGEEGHVGVALAEAGRVRRPVVATVGQGAETVEGQPRWRRRSGGPIGVGHHQVGPAGIEDGPGLLGAEEAVHGDEDGSDLGQSGKQRHGVERRGRPQGDPRPAADPEP